MKGPLAIIAGRSNPALASAAAATANVGVASCELMNHADSEIGIEIRDNVRGHDVFVIQSTSSPANDHLMELLIILDALKRASANRVTAVLPYFGYARQDRKNRPRQPITAKLVADLITAAGANRILTMDLHAGQIMGFFNLPVDNLYARPVFLKYLQENFGDGDAVTIVSPDAGGVARARAYAKRLDAGIAIIDKRRAVANEVAEMNVVGDAKGKVAIIIDDMVDTGGTLVKAAEALLANGATQVVACCTHAVLSRDAIAKLRGSNVSRVIVSDTIAHPNFPEDDERFVRLSVASIIGEAIRRIHEESSVSSLFEIE
ncbi:MAG: ribose-phosphate pyrophosphokinase [Deltaproteobacteria bacterium]|nr:ribose-phosphate pyrophosphokinase [Deltaproteobacteria bacterium]